VRRSSSPAPVLDTHSYARPHEARVTSLHLDLQVDFAAHQVRGRASITVERAAGASVIVLDTRDLLIHAVTADDGAALAFELGEGNAVLGRPLTIRLPAPASRIHIDYETGPGAAALQWLEPPQTAGKRHPFLYSQGQAILTRTWIPTQDSPGVRQTYTARIHVPSGLTAVMSAEAVTRAGLPPGTPTEVDADGGRTFEFRLSHPVPPYLIALAAGELVFAPVGDRTGVYAEPATIEAAAWEFADMEGMLDAAERLLGPYDWGRYDVLVLPPSFPFGGMENPRVTFVTPTVLAGDRSLVSLIAHELAHSWSGNLVTNATWRDFWLNEGVTTYVESRIMEALAGREYADMLRVLSRRELLDEIERLGGPASPDTVLYIDLDERDPDEGATRIPYDKGAALMTLLESTVGRARFDEYLHGYFARHAFTSITTATFLADLRTHLFGTEADAEPPVRLNEWVFEPGLPDSAVQPASAILDGVRAQADAFAAGAPARRLKTSGWTTHHWLHFLASLPVRLGEPQLQDLDETFGLSERGNSEVLAAWLRIAIRHAFDPALPAVERFLLRQGRRKFLRPLYEDLMATPWGHPHARRIYAAARPSYHAVATGTLDTVVR
jgi:leukotriene-A4 hydrolase